MPKDWRHIPPDADGNKFQNRKSGEMSKEDPCLSAARLKFQAVLKGGAAAGAAAPSDNSSAATPKARKPKFSHTDSERRRLASEMGFSPRTGGSFSLDSPGSFDDGAGSGDGMTSDDEDGAPAPSPSFSSSYGLSPMGGVLGGRKSRRRGTGRPLSGGAGGGVLALGGSGRSRKRLSTAGASTTTTASGGGGGSSPFLSSLATVRRRSLPSSRRTTPKPSVHVADSSDSDDVEGLMASQMQSMRTRRPLEKGSGPKVRRRVVCSDRWL